MSKRVLVSVLLTQADKLAEKRTKLGTQVDLLEQAAARQCKHPKASVFGYYDQFRSGPPWAICIECGYAEEGWGIGYWKLPSIDWSERQTLNFSALMKKRRFFRTQRDIIHEKIHVKHHGAPREMDNCETCRSE